MAPASHAALAAGSVASGAWGFDAGRPVTDATLSIELGAVEGEAGKDIVQLDVYLGRNLLVPGADPADIWALVFPTLVGSITPIAGGQYTFAVDPGDLALPAGQYSDVCLRPHLEDGSQAGKVRVADIRLALEFALGLGQEAPVGFDAGATPATFAPAAVDARASAGATDVTLGLADTTAAFGGGQA